ncbi:hypothetical protein CVT24_002881 [Panaeolus cyanescens]|uniref:TOG domain-containing protein n=1 Tax=Panaeolus cyanescens TaxID=181874 RepID=A0A409YXT8_9AGAR|nr:hypothetical protein CVT24_002881 [Panaeolus cyanescens]
MESVVPTQITQELTQILSNLVLGDNEIRANAEKAVNERLVHTPELYLLALAQFAITADTEVMRSFSLFAITADTEVMRSFSLVLLRRLLFRTSPSPSPTASRLTLYDQLSHQTLTTLERLLLYTLSHETSAAVRRKAIDTICDLANQSMLRGRPWHALQAQTFSMVQVQDETEGVQNWGYRESAFRVFAGCPNLVMDLQIDAVLSVLQGGLRDRWSIDVRHAALLASVEYLTHADPGQLSQSLCLIPAILETLPALASSLSSPPLGASLPNGPKTSNYHYLSTFLSTLTPLASTHPILFAPHLQNMLTFLPSLILPPVDCGPTPTVGRPYPTGGGRQGAFVFPPPSGSQYDDDDTNGSRNGVDDDGEGEDDTEADERSTLRLSALEFMVSLSEARPAMVKKMTGWTEVIVRACLEGMGEGEDEVEAWLAEDPSLGSPTDTDSQPALYEQALDRLACALGGRAVLPPAFQYIPSMLASYDWRVRHAGLMAIAAIGEGTGRVMLKELEKIVDLVVPMFNDSHPRQRTDLYQRAAAPQEVIQRQYHQKLFSALIPALEDPEPRVHAHAAAALINFCEGVERDTLLPYLDAIVVRLLKLLDPESSQPPSSPTQPTQPPIVHRYVQEQAITTLAMVADASEGMFAKHYSTIMPMLLNVLRNAEGKEFGKLKAKAMECAGLIAIAVGPDVFRPDSKSLIEILFDSEIETPQEATDTQMAHYLIATWSKVCQAMRGEFEPYLPIVMPSLLAAASVKADLSLYDDDDDTTEEKEGYETVMMDGRTYGVKTSVMDEKCEAFETLVIYCHCLGAKFAPYLAQTLEITLPCLKFYFHEGVREACAILIPMLLSCGKESQTLTNQMVAATFNQLINCIITETDASFLSSLFKHLTESLRVLGGPSPLTATFHEPIIEATKRQLQSLADKRKARAARANSASGGVGGIGEMDREELALLEEIEDFALEDMGKMLSLFDSNHPLLVAVGSVRDLGFNTYDSEEEDEGDE